MYVKYHFYCLRNADGICTESTLQHEGRVLQSEARRGHGAPGGIKVCEVTLAVMKRFYTGKTKLRQDDRGSRLSCAYTDFANQL